MGRLIWKLRQNQARPFTREESIEAKIQLEKLIKDKKVRISRSESAAPTLFVLKGDGSKRWCMDNMRRLNEVTTTDSNQAPLQETARERLKGAKYFTKLDMTDGYHHLRKVMNTKRPSLPSMVCYYEWTVMCFGLKNAPAEFARYMSENLREYLNDFVVVYFDDLYYHFLGESRPAKATYN